MSYEKVSSINEKNRTITMAANNIRPLTYYVCPYPPDTTLDDFRSNTLIAILFGDYHMNNKNHKYNCVAATIKATDEYQELHEKIWNFDKTYSIEYCREHYQENKQKLRELVLKMFNEYKKDKSKYIIGTKWYYVTRINKWSFSYCTNKAKAKIFNRRAVAEDAAKHLNDEWKVIKLDNQEEQT